ncbi:VWA domain-containing protein [Nannocystaceae bacterium ST9]
MRRFVLTNTHRRLLQLGLLAGIGVALIGQREPVATAGGGDDCFTENMCTFKKPNFMIVLDYSSSMNTAFGMGKTRWEVAVDAISTLMTTNGGYFQENMHVGLMRYGHDPDPANPGTEIPGDESGLVDGQSVDVPWYDAEAADKTYFDCNGQAIIDALADMPPPLCQGNPCSGIGTWTKGALDRTEAMIGQSKLDHPDDVIPGEERFYGVMVVTDGAWTGPAGFPQLSPADQNPALTAGPMFDQDGIPTYVVAVADANNLPFADELASAGGTGTAIGADNPAQLNQAIGQVVQDIADQVIVPECTSGLPRVMVLLDASSSMLNVGEQPGDPGQTGWDRARSALASGADSLFDVDVETVGRPVEDLVHLGLAVFGSDQPAEEKLLVQYGPCMQDNFAWALDPNTSCELPGCDDPWGGPPISWTFKDGADVPPFFDQSTRSHMPACAPAPGFSICQGSGTFTHRGLQLVLNNQQAYAANPPVNYPVDENTQYVNILITDGQYNGYSTDAQVQTALETLFANGVTTFVIGFGDNLGSAQAQTQLANMAAWGSDGQQNFFDADTQAELENAMKSIVETIEFDPCCVFNDCSENPEPTTAEPDPGMDSFTGDGTEGTDGTADTVDGTASDTNSGTGTSTATDSDGDGTSDTADTDADGTDDVWDSDADGTSDIDGTADSFEGGNSADEIGDGFDGDGFGFGNDAGLNGRCNCSTETEPAGGLLSLLGLGLLGLSLRRRRG